MRRNEKITKIMTKDPSTVHIHQKLSEVRAAMTEGGFHHIPVVSGKKLVGLLSSTDLLRVSYEYGQDLRQTNEVLDHTVSIEGLMTDNLLTLSPQQTIRDAVEVFATGKLHSLPVVNADGHLLGMVTTTDVLSYMLEQY